MVQSQLQRARRVRIAQLVRLQHLSDVALDYSRGTYCSGCSWNLASRTFKSFCAVSVGSTFSWMSLLGMLHEPKKIEQGSDQSLGAFGTWTRHSIAPCAAPPR